MEQPQGPVEMDGDVQFKKDTKSNMMKAVSGTEWMYKTEALKKGKQVGTRVCVCMCAFIHACMCRCTCVHVCMCARARVCGY